LGEDTMRLVGIVATCLALLAGGGVARAGTEEDVRATFEKFVAAQNAHDSKAVGELLLDAPGFLWITRGAAVWGRAEALKRFEALYAGTWQLAPIMAEFRMVAVTAEAAQFYVPIDFQIGPPGQAAQTTRFLMNQTLIKTPAGWKVASILPIPGPPPAAPK